MEKILLKSFLCKRKMGFLISLDKWAQHNLRRPIKNLSLNSGSFLKRDVLNKDCIIFILRGHNNGRRNSASCIWDLLWLEFWFRIFIEKEIEPFISSEIQ